MYIVSDANALDDEAFYAKYRQRLRELKARIAAEKKQRSQFKRRNATVSNGSS